MLLLLLLLLLLLRLPLPPSGAEHLEQAKRAEMREEDRSRASTRERAFIDLVGKLQCHLGETGVEFAFVRNVRLLVQVGRHRVVQAREAR